MTTTAPSRQQTREAIAAAGASAAPLDVLIIGGGIVGAGVTRDAAMRGLNVALVDRRDFAFGTSSRSSRLLHGGLRYLAQGRIGLVREASVEKVILARIAPHLAEPLPFIFPTRDNGPWKRWKLLIGVKLYDLLCGGRNFGKSSGLSRDQLLQLLPQLSTDHLTGGVRYFDGFTSDARLVLDTLRSASAAGANLLNYVAFESLQRDDNQLWNCRLRDQLTGESFEATARTIVNAAGAWAESFAASRVQLRLTKGVHVVIDRSRLRLPSAVVMTAGDRILFAIPWGERTILGTTDTDYDGSPDHPTCDPEDIRYILNIANDTFPACRLIASDVISSWAGLRPLIAQGERGTPSDVSRAHQIRMTEPGWFDVAGGKLTTYRLMAEQTIDQVVKFAGIDARACATATTPLLPRSDEVTGVLPPAVSHEAVEHYCRQEWAVHLDDVMTRRTGWRLYHRDHESIARQVALWMRDLLGWTEGGITDELSNYAAAGCGGTDNSAPIASRPVAASS